MQINEKALLEQIRNIDGFTQRSDGRKHCWLNDSLTGLFSRCAGEAFVRSNLSLGLPITVALVDLVHFKQVNEQWGHESGDQILAAVGQELVAQAEGFEVICRWEGARFLAVSTGNVREVERLAHSLRNRLCKSYAVKRERTQELNVRVSVGLAHAHSGDEFEELLARAESELDRHKQQYRALAPVL